MDDGHLPSLLLLGLLIGLHALVQLAYAALTNLRLTPWKERADEGDRNARKTLTLVENHSQLFLASEILLISLRLAITALAVVGLAQPLIANAEEGLLADPLAGVLVVLIPVGLLVFTLGDLIPSTLGRAFADSIVKWAAPTTRLIMLILKPLLLLSNGIQALVSRLSGAEGLEKHVTEEEIMSLVDVGHSGGTIEHDEKEMIYSVLQFNEISAREIMIPRPDITAVEIDEPIHEALKTIVESGHSRIPVYDSEIDDIQGMLFAKDLLTAAYKGELEKSTVRQLMRKAHFIPESKRADDLFKEMQAGNIHIAIVVDEYGSTAGLVTIEDLIEEIVGDIRDEYDQDEATEFTKLGEDTFLVDGAMQLNELNERLERELSTEDSDTLGGYVYSRLGYIPEVGETLEADHLVLRIEKVENRRIRTIHITRQPKPIDDDDDEGDDRAKDKEREKDKERGGNGTLTDRQARAATRPIF